ncbi:hypothetical protein T484DRAFT_1825300 [Baffinella frigidus]|nr:hypothetical protein T484DRAFT_1825300 [Cryptophyta sp. CCMP2293]
MAQGTHQAPVIVALLIVSNFASSAVEAELQLQDEASKHLFAVIDDCFTWIFVIEIGLNIFAHW